MEQKSTQHEQQLGSGGDQDAVDEESATTELVRENEEEKRSTGYLDQASRRQSWA